MAPDEKPVRCVSRLGDPAAAWSAWTMTQRRELLRLLFAGIAVKHVGYRSPGYVCTVPPAPIRS